MKQLGIILSLVFAAQSALAADKTLSTVEQSIVKSVDAAFEQQINFLERTVNINSGTRNLPGVRRTGDVYMQEFQKLGFANQWLDMPKEMDRAGHMVSKKKFGATGKRILLIGHLDTVFPKNSPFQKFDRQGMKAYGPGIADMKGGNAVVLYALKALIDGGYVDKGAVTVFFTGDEESTGKPISISRKAMIETAKVSDYALNFEGGSAGFAVIGRRGSSGWKLTVQGKRAHSAGVFNDRVGPGAIFEASRILNAFYNEVKGEHGLTFNPGVMAGGTFVNVGKDGAGYDAFGKTNVVAQKVVVKGGLRFLNEAQKERARDKMRVIVAKNLPQTSAQIIFNDSYPAMEATKANLALFQKLNQVTIAMGMKPLKPFDPTKRGAADISFVAPYVTSMDALGVWGGSSHRPGEWVDLKSMNMATRRTALFLYRLLQED